MSGAFRGGAHPDDAKKYSKDAPIHDAPVPVELTIPFSQHIGKPASPVVKPLDEVKRGQVIAEAAGFVSAAVHSPVSGKVLKIVQTLHPMGMVCDAAVIQNDGADAWAEGCNIETDTSTLSAEQIKAAVQAAGIVGMGGATFPTHVKLSPPPEKKIDVVILNGVECEPYLTADYRLMLESPATVVKGLLLAMKAVGAARGIVGIEANKPDAFKIMKAELAKAGGNLEAQLLPVMYPQGAEKQLIYACLKREVPSGGLPMDAGVVVQNVGTAHAIYEACAFKRPLTERITSVTGPGVERPANLRVRIGTPVRALLELCGFKEKETKKLIYGGPMMGAAHYNTDVVVNKGMSGILALTDVIDEPYRDCIRCGRCVDGCPMGLVPSELSILAETGRYLDTKDKDVLDCIECGVCTYVCPARRPIVQWLKVCKSELAKARAQAAK
jgi:electron transport complex protein RnfC